MPIVIEGSYLNAVSNAYNIIEDKVLCNYGRDKGILESKISLPTSDIKASYLIVALTRSSKIDFTKWKLSFNDVILTREFKPHIENNIDDEYVQTVFVYDVTKVVFGNEVSLRISCNAKGYVYLDGVTLLTIAHYNGFNTQFYCEVNPYSIGNSEIKFRNLRPDIQSNEFAINLGLIAENHGYVELLVDNDFTKRIELLKGYNLIEVTLKRINVNNIQINSNTTDIRHVFSCTEFRYVMYPKIIVEEASIIDSTIKIKVKNIGESQSDSLEVLVLRYGIPMYRSAMPNPKPYECIEFEVPLDRKQSTSLSGLVLRLIWRKAHRVFEYDIPLKTL